MANMKRQPVSYRPFRVDPLLSEGLLAVARPGGELEEKVAEAFFRIADEQGRIADEEARAAGALAGQLDALSGRPRVAIEGGGAATGAGGRPFKTNDPVAGDLPPVARAFLNAVAGGESGGQYNIRYTPKGGATFSDLSRHPGIMEPGPHGKSSAAGRYQFTKTTWERLGGGDFSPENQDRRAWQLAQQDYRARTGRPLLADLEANGLTPQMLSAMSPTWAAFNHNRDRHIATYRDSLQRFVGQGAMPPPQTGAATEGVDPAVQAPKIVTTGGAWRPTRANTIRGRAYDAAGTRTYLQALNLEIEQTTEQLYEKFREDPAGLAEAMQDLKAEQLAEHVFPEVQAEYELTFDRRSGALVMRAQRELERRREEENRGAFLERTRELEDTMSRQLAGLDPDDAAAVQDLHATQRQLEEHYDAAVAHGLIAPDTAARAKRAAAGEAASGFYAAQADRMDSEGVGAFREQLRADYAAGKLDGIDADAWTDLEARLARLEASKGAEESQAAKALAERGQRQLARVEMGLDPDPGEMSRLKLDQGTAPDGPQIVDTAERMIAAAKALRDLSLPDARRYVAELAEKAGKNATDAEAAQLAYAQQRLAQLEKLAIEDPVAYEIASGRVQLAPLALGGSDEELAASLADRRRQMGEIADRYGTELEIFRPGERRALAKMMAEAPEQMPRLVKSLRDALGPDATTALAEISDDAPALAHAAGVAIATGDDGFVEEMSQALAAKTRGDYKLKMPGPEKFASAAGPQFAQALAGLDRTRTAALQSAQLVFEREANLYGFDPSKIDEEGQPAHAAWQRALNRALGGQFRNGRQLGGLGEVNGLPIVVPPGMDVDEPQRLLHAIDDAALEKLPPIRTGNGVPITPVQIRRGRLVAAGDGRYRVALDDPFGFEPRWLVGTDGDFWILDLNRLAGILPRRRGLFQRGREFPDALRPRGESQ